MVRALCMLMFLACFAAGPARSQESADSSAALGQEQEDALESAEGETGLVLDDAIAPAPGPTARDWGLASAGRLRVAGDALALGLSVAWPARNGLLDALLAREPGEQRLFDDAHARLTWRPRAAWTLALGRVAPDAGAGLVLGPPRTGTRMPSPLVRGHALSTAPLPWTPARAAAGFTGAWALAAIGPVRAGLLGAVTRRDARAVGDALLPLAGVRHRDARGDSARGALEERVFALALEAGPAWVVLAHARANAYRMPAAGATTAAQRASRVVRGGHAAEIGLRRALARGASAQGALAFDARGRKRTALSIEVERARTRAVVAFESEATDFVPLRARPEHLPHAHAGAVVRGPLGRGAWRLEAHALERNAYEPVRGWATLRLSGRSGSWIELRRDADPARTLVGFCVSAAPHLALYGELRYDRSGLARETWRVRADTRLPGGWTGALELRLGSARGSLAWLDSEVPGGAWVATGAAAERTRIELARPGRVAPRLAWLRTRTQGGTRSEARLGVEWSAEP